MLIGRAILQCNGRWRAPRESTRLCTGGLERINCRLKKLLNFALFDAQQLRAHGTRITEEETQDKAGTRKSLDLHHRPEAGLEHRAVKHVYTGVFSRTRCNAPRSDSILPGVEISLSGCSRYFKLIDAVEQGGFRRVDICR